MLDMGDRLQAARRAAFVAMGIMILCAGPWVGYLTFVPYAASALVFALTERNLLERRRPEYWTFAGWAFCQMMIASAVLIAGEAGVYFLPWLGVPTVTLVARFTVRGQAFGIALTALLIIAVVIAADPALAWSEPYRAIAPLSCVIGLAALARPLMHSELEHRAEALIDALTGLPNRAALQRDAAELLVRADAEGVSLGVLIADIDHFKSINDTHGHDKGDEVLQDTAEAMRGAMRSLDDVYRFGGEEFVVLLFGAGIRAAEEIAERIRVNVEGKRPGGLPVSISIGVTVGMHGSELPALLRDADEALYRAKGAGRNRVATAAPRAA